MSHLPPLTKKEIQQSEFNHYFEQIQQQYWELLGSDYIGTIRRLGLITFRIAMILSAIRIMDSGGIAQIMVCEDADFQSALAIVKVLLQHTAKVFQTLPTTDSPRQLNGEPTQLRQTFFDNLSPKFDRKGYLQTSEQLTIPPKTADKYIANLCAAGKLTHTKHGEYCQTKVEPQCATVKATKSPLKRAFLCYNKKCVKLTICFYLLDANILYFCINISRFNLFIILASKTMLLPNKLKELRKQSELHNESCRST